MNPTVSALLNEGRPRDALAVLKDDVRARPADASARFALFEAFALLGDLERAKSQLEVAVSLDAKLLPLGSVYGGAVDAEAVRRDVFAGKHQPVVVGEPEPWLAGLVEGLRLDADGHGDRARDLRNESLGQATPVAGTCDGAAFEWLMDGDSRLGPILEAVVRGEYRWIPFGRIHRLEIAAPAGLADLVWSQVDLTWAQGGTTRVFVPSRYVGSDRADDDALVLGRKTAWHELAAESFAGLGQRELLSADGEFAWLACRTIEFATNGST